MIILRNLDVFNNTFRLTCFNKGIKKNQNVFDRIILFFVENIIKYELTILRIFARGIKERM